MEEMEQGYKITVIDENKTKFRSRYSKPVNVVQSFDRTKITITQAGQTFNIYDRIQENTSGTDIYENLKMYGNLSQMQQHKPDEAIYGDLTNIGDLRSTMEKIKTGKNLWANISKEDKEHFNNDIYKFIDGGLEYYKTKIKQKNEKIEEGKKNEQK